MKPSTNVKVVATLFLLQMIIIMPFSQAYVYIIPNAKSQGKLFQYNIYILMHTYNFYFYF